MTFPRPDMSSLQALTELTAQMQAAAGPTDAHERAEKMRALRDEIQSMVGTASDEAGHITATYTAADGFSGLALDPKAMRMPSVDLAAEIVRLAKEARSDFEEQRRALTSSEYGDIAAMDMEQAQANIEDVRRQFTDSLGDVQALMEKFRSGLTR